MKVFRGKLVLTTVSGMGVPPFLVQRYIKQTNQNDNEAKYLDISIKIKDYHDNVETKLYYNRDYSNLGQATDRDQLIPGQVKLWQV